MTVKKFYTLGSSTVAVRTVQGSNDTLNWILGDHLGSTTVTANADGTWNSEIKYTAFGEVRASYGLTPTDYRYTGQLDVAELGLIYFVARFYDPVLTHFVQADTLIPDPGDQLAWDRYAYVKSNPIRYSDPSGHFIFEDPQNPPFHSYKTGAITYGETVFLNPTDAESIYGVKTPMRVTWATVNDPHNAFNDIAAGLIMGMMQTGKSSIGVGNPSSVPKNLIGDVYPQQNVDPQVNNWQSIISRMQAGNLKAHTEKHAPNASGEFLQARASVSDAAQTKFKNWTQMIFVIESTLHSNMVEINSLANSGRSGTQSFLSRYAVSYIGYQTQNDTVGIISGEAPARIVIWYDGLGDWGLYTAFPQP